MPKKKFRMALVVCMTRSSATLAMSSSRPEPSTNVLDRIRNYNIAHHRMAMPPRKCVVCKKSVRMQCVKCAKTLHIN